MEDYKQDDKIVFKNLEYLTMFADYRVPQTLRHAGIFEYNKELAELIDAEKELPYSSKYEIEIRAATIVAVEMILTKINESAVLKNKITYSF